MNIALCPRIASLLLSGRCLCSWVFSELRPWELRLRFVSRAARLIDIKSTDYCLGIAKNASPHNPACSRPLCARKFRDESRLRYTLGEAFDANSRRLTPGALGALSASNVSFLSNTQENLTGILGRAMRHLLGLLIVLLLSSCSNVGVGSPISTPTPVTAISLEEAKRIAIETGSHGQPEIAPLSTRPRVLQAELLTFKEIYDRQNTSMPRNEDPQTLVWYVQLEGLWKDAYPRPTTSPTAEPLPHLIVMIDGQTGFVYSVGMSR